MSPNVAVVSVHPSVGFGVRLSSAGQMVTDSAVYPSLLFQTTAKTYYAIDFFVGRLFLMADRLSDVAYAWYTSQFI